MGTLVQNEDPVLNRRVTENLIVIERDAPLPAKHTVAVATIHDDQEALDCSVTQSEGRENNQEFVNLIHQGTLNLPDKKICITNANDLDNDTLRILKLLIYDTFLLHIK